MAQMPPDVTGAATTSVLLSQDVVSFLERPTSAEMWLAEGAYLLDAIEVYWDGEVPPEAALTAAYQIFSSPSGRPETAGPANSFLLSDNRGPDRVEFGGLFFMGPTRIRLPIRNARLHGASPENVRGVTLTILAHIRQVDYDPDAVLDEYVPIGDEGLGESVSEDDLGEYIAHPTGHIEQPLDMGENMPRIVGAREGVHLPFWDRGADTTVEFATRGVERLDTTWHDAYICDFTGGNNFCPKARQTGQKRLFQRVEKDPFVSNIPVAGQVPSGAAFHLTRVGLTLSFSDPELYGLAFRYLRVTLFHNGAPIRAYLASEWLDAAVAQHFDPDPSLGFSWSIPTGSLVIPPLGNYHVDLDLAEPLAARLRLAEDAIQEYMAQGGWTSMEDEEFFSRWYAEIRISLKGHRVRGVL